MTIIMPMLKFDLHPEASGWQTLTLSLVLRQSNVQQIARKTPLSSGVSPVAPWPHLFRLQGGPYVMLTRLTVGYFDFRGSAFVSLMAPYMRNGFAPNGKCACSMLQLLQSTPLTAAALTPMLLMTDFYHAPYIADFIFCYFQTYLVVLL